MSIMTYLFISFAFFAIYINVFYFTDKKYHKTREDIYLIVGLSFVCGIMWFISCFIVPLFLYKSNKFKKEKI